MGSNAQQLRVHAEPFSLDLPYATRQQIVVLPDEVVQAERAALAQLMTGEKADSPSAGEVVAKVMSEVASLTLAGITLVAIEVAVGAVIKLRQKGVRVLMTAHSETSSLQFEPGHPLEKVVYVGHPAVPSLYFPLADFHRRVFEHKFCEAVNLVMALGASDLKVERVRGYGHELAANLEVPLSAGERIGARIGKKRETNSHLLFTAEFPGSSEPSVPEDLAWLQSEPTWRMLANARVLHGTQKFSLQVNYGETYNITAGVSGAIEGVGLEAGGEFSAPEHTVWRLDATFPPMQAKARRTSPA